MARFGDNWEKEFKPAWDIASDQRIGGGTARSSTRQLEKGQRVSTT